MVGVLLLAVPAAFTVFPKLTEIHGSWRLLIALVWVVLAALAIGSAALRDRRVEEVTRGLAEDRIRLRYQLRTGAFGASLRTLLNPAAHGIPGSYEFTIYIFEPADGQLRAIYPAWDGQETDPRAFEPGKGATGKAWETDDLVVVKDDAVSNTQYGLTPAQQALWADYRRALSYPLYKDLTTQIGALTALSKDEDDFFDSPPGQALFRELANVVAVILLTVPPTERVPGGG